MDVVGVVRGATGGDGRYNQNVPQGYRGLPGEDPWRDYLSLLLRNLLGRTGLIYNTREFRLRREPGAAPAGPEPVEDPGYLADRGTIRIACISSPIVVGGAQNANPELDLRLQSFRDQTKLFRPVRGQGGDAWAAERLKELDAALEGDPHVICFGELAYPPPELPEGGGWTTQDIEEAVRRRQNFEAQVKRRLAKARRPPFVFLGSYHCLMTLYNIGVMYPWGSSTKEVPVDILVEHLEHSDPEYQMSNVPVKPPILYQKRFPARRAGEATRIPHGQAIDVFNMPFGRIGVFICSDVLDLNQFLAITNRNRAANRHNPLDFILIPSLNTSPKLASMCRELSFIATTTVIMVNANHHNNGYPDTELFCCGFDAKALTGIRQRFLTVSTPSIVDHGNGRKAVVQTYEIGNELSRAFRERKGKELLAQGAPGNFTGAKK